VSNIIDKFHSHKNSCALQDVIHFRFAYEHKIYNQARTAQSSGLTEEQTPVKWVKPPRHLLSFLIVPPPPSPWLPLEAPCRIHKLFSDFLHGSIVEIMLLNLNSRNFRFLLFVKEETFVLLRPTPNAIVRGIKAQELPKSRRC